MKSYPEKSFSLNFEHPFDSRGCLKFRLGNLLHKVVLLVVLACRNCECNYKTEPFLLLCTKGSRFKGNLVSVIVFTFLTFMSTCDWLISKFVSRFCLGGLRSCSRTTVNELLKPFSLRHGCCVWVQVGFEWRRCPAWLKCKEIGVGSLSCWWIKMDRRCSPNRSVSWRLVSPMYLHLHLLHWNKYIRFLDLQDN